MGLKVQEITEYASSRRIDHHDDRDVLRNCREGNFNSSYDNRPVLSSLLQISYRVSQLGETPVPVHVTVNGREVTDPRIRGAIIAAGFIIAAFVVLIVLPLIGLAIAIGLGLAVGVAVALGATRMLRLSGRRRESLPPGSHRELRPPQLPKNDNTSEQ